MPHKHCHINIKNLQDPASKTIQADSASKLLRDWLLSSKARHGDKLTFTIVLHPIIGSFIPDPEGGS